MLQRVQFCCAMCKQVSSLFPLYSLISLIPFHSHPGNERNYREGAGYQPPRAYVSKAREWANSPGKYRTRAAAGENWREKHPAFFQNPQETRHSGSREAQKNLCWHVSEAPVRDAQSCKVLSLSLESKNTNSLLSHCQSTSVSVWKEFL